MPTTPARYEPVSLLGSGGMGSVYLAVWRGGAGFSRLVAMKKAHAGLMHRPEARKSFVREARLAAAIRHANVVAVLDVEEEDEGVTLVLEYVEGVSLSELARHSGPLRPALAGRILLDVARGLHAAHETFDAHGRPLAIVHRDVSPHNILVGRDGVARITDFGVAQVARDSRAEDSDGTRLKGKIAYMAPEYLEHGSCDRRADVFSLGVVAWEVFVGERLFRHEREIETIRRVLEGDIAPVSTRARHLPSALDAVVGRALARDPHRRFASCREFAQGLEAVLHEHGLRASPEELSAAVEAAAGEVLEARRVAARAHLAHDATPVLGRAADEPTAELSAVDRVPDRQTETGSMSVPSAPLRSRPKQRMAKAAFLGATLLAGAALISTLIVGRSRHLLVHGVPAPARLAGQHAQALVQRSAAERASSRAPSARPVRPSRPRPVRQATRREPSAESRPGTDKAPPNPYRRGD
jgi:serine/threonine-protein kinase